MEHITVEEREALAFGLSYERELEYSKLSPFEITDILEEESIKGCKRRQVEECTILNSGRGNPNFLNTVVRKAFAKLILFSTEIANSLAEEEFLGYRPKKEGIADRLEEYLQQDKSKEGQFLQKAITYAQERFQFNKDDFVFEMVDGALGDFYPYPSRILPHTANLINAYLSEILMVEDIASDQFNFFATEGATQAMVYSFRSLKENGILHCGDKVATITPIFAPYLQIPKLDDYELINIEIKESEEMEWQIPEGELRKLEDEEIKVLYLVNPINPSSVTIDSDTIDKIAELVKNKRRDLIIMTDTVYANFVEGFYSLVSAIPENTICIYSYSKYFGVTGWRLGAIMLHQDNVVDHLISELSPKEKERLQQRYSIISTEPDEIKFIDRLVIDSRDVALAHTGGLSTP
ncbi:bifunctional aspartate transaminase/aspartate 4-decarboxylase [Orenia metallireducens]|uniref:bifunctional aspartate transaminase/aspartate 4-decarboxylase n=1 Tax=Orenia metallireducens TaxID=1413210 RepID=UPI0009F45767|nr:bifunctional aspartate transaminase/aspartate 4-decarboxylase [Orenia metallireducens]